MAPRFLPRWWSTYRTSGSNLRKDRILQQTAKRIADRLEAKRDLVSAEKSLMASEKASADAWKAQAEGLRSVRGKQSAVERVITGVERKFHGEEQLKLTVEKCASKVEGEIQKKMATVTGENQLASLRTRPGPGHWGQDRMWDQLEHQRKPTKSTSKASLVEDGWKE